MGKFKIGDRVRVLPRNKALPYSYHGAQAGKEYTVKAVRGTTGDNIDTEMWSFFDHEIELVAPPLKIEAGKFYKTRDGRKVGPLMTTDNNEYWPFKWPEQTMYYKADGYSCHGAANRHRDQDDLIAEWPETANVGAQVDTLAEEYGPAPHQEPDTTLHIKFTSDFSELDAAILVRKKKLKKLIKLARKAGIELREAA